MDRSDILQFFGTYIIPLASAAVGWIAGSRKRRNDFLKDLQASIDLLSSENRRLLADITAVNAEIVAVRKENEELKVSVDRLCAENAQLQDEIRLLREQVGTRKSESQTA
jgi:peptidoglycan hydrolase CwlO-like protein